jgi:hypothetical protein
MHNAATTADLGLGKLMDTPPPGADEAITISKVGADHAGGCFL